MTSQPTYGILIAKDVMVPMRDGVRLAADIYYPARDGERVAGQFPTILLRTSYDKAAQRYVDTIANFFTPRGYVTVQQDLRGRYNSEGFGQYWHVANPHEGKDGYDTIEWIAAQSWSNGKVGMVGSSHPGLVQTHAALYRPPHLTAIWPDVAPTNSYQQQVRRGGAMQLHMFGALFLHAQDSQQARADANVHAVIFEAMKRMRKLVYATPFKPGHTPLSVVPNLEKTLFDYYYRGSYDEFWQAEYSDFTRYYERHADIPGTFSGGWFDPFTEATTGQYAALAKQSQSPQRLIIGPWTHMGMRGVNMSHAGDVDFGPDAIWGFERFNPEQLRFFDRWLKGDENGIEHEPPIRIFVMGGSDGKRNANGRLNHGGHWRAEHEWPLARTRYTNYYLHADGTLSTELPNPKSQTPNDQLPIINYQSPRRFTYDPSNPVPTIGGTVVGYFEIVPLNQPLDPFWRKYLPPWAIQRQIIQDGPAHQKEEPGIVACKPPYLPLSMRKDVLVFQTPPLENDVEVTGPMTVNLWIASSAVDTDFTAKLIDVHPANDDYPEGYHMLLCDSIIRCRYRNSFEREELMTPGEIYQVQIVLPPTSNMFMKGHRIRLDISSSNFPRFDLNPNTGEPMGRHTHTLVAHNAVYCDAEHPSHVVLPIIPSA
jgi:putative CocE/NonD family hydrolase